MPLPDVPTLSISYSALAQWARCERSFWLSRVGAWQAWRGGTRAGDPEAAAAYRNKHIVSADQLLGIVVHELAAEVVTAIRDGRRPPLREELHRTLRARLAAVWRRDRDAFIEAPKGRIIHEHFYGVQHRAAALEVLRAKVGAAIRRLVESELLQDLMEADRGEIITVDSLDATAFTGGGGLPVVPLYAAADLVLCSATRSVHVDGVRLEPPVPQIVELKTSMRLREAEVRLQLATLAIHARDRLGLEPHARTGAYAGRVVDLSPRGAADWYVLIGPRDIEAAAAHLRAGLADIVARPADERGVMRRAAARRTDAPERHCASCGLLEACALSRDAEVLPAERHRYPTPPELAGVIPAPSGA